MLTFTPSPDVAFILNIILDTLEKRAKNTQHATRNNIKITLSEISLPAYFSQTDPNPRIIANEQFIALEKANLLSLNWISGERGNLLQAVIFQTRNTDSATLYTLLNREPVSDSRERLDKLIRADLFRYTADDWRIRALKSILKKLRDGKSPSPFSLTDTDLNLGLLTALDALSEFQTETPYRVFSVRVFNDSKRFDELNPAIVRLARMGNLKWKKLSNKEILRELHLVSNPSYIHLAGNWQLTTKSGEILPLGGFSPSIGFPAAQVESLHAATVHAESILCIENLTSFHEFIRFQEKSESQRLRSGQARKTKHAIICLMGNPSPPIRHLLNLIPETIPIYLWSDLDYGGFNILSQLRKEIRYDIEPYRMDAETLTLHARLARPLTRGDERNLKRLLNRPELRDSHKTIKYLLETGLKLEQEAVSAV